MFRGPPFMGSMFRGLIFWGSNVFLTSYVLVVQWLGGHVLGVNFLFFINSVNHSEKGEKLSRETVPLN